MDYIKEILAMTKKWNYLGVLNMENGTTLIGKAPHIAPQAWLHHIFPPLSEEEIGILEEQVEIKMPDNLKFFFKQMNGLEIFNTTFCIDGLRKNYKRDIENIWQPFSLFTANTIERIKDAKKEYLFFGGYDYDGSKLYINTITNKVYRCSRTTTVPLNEWKDFESMILSEINRIDKLFDKEGKEINPNVPTTP